MPSGELRVAGLRMIIDRKMKKILLKFSHHFRTNFLHFDFYLRVKKTLIKNVAHFHLKIFKTVGVDEFFACARQPPQHARPGVAAQGWAIPRWRGRMMDCAALCVLARVLDVVS